VYNIFLRNDKTRFYDRFAVLIFILNGLGLISVIIYSGPEANTGDFKGLWLGLAVFIIAAPIMAILKKGNKPSRKAFISSTLPVILFWVFVEYWWFGVILAILVMLYLQSKKELAVFIEAKKIIYPSFPEKKIDWEDLNNLILKDQLLTIDFKNNKLIQQYIDPNKSYKINEQEFNDFCKRQIMLSQKVI
jgi:hypothetical protein